MAAIEQFLTDNPEFKDQDRKKVADFVFETQMKGVDRAKFDEFFLCLLYTSPSPRDRG